jgi:DNA-binding HxlR family transcriptional regulator
VAKTYNQYCPIACALDLVGERWSLLIVRELLEHGQLRYSDLHPALEGCGTNILAGRLKDLESGGVVQRTKLPPLAASTDYELREYVAGLHRALNELAHWGARRMGPPETGVSLGDDWLLGALQIAFPPLPTTASVEFRIDGEIAAFVDGRVVRGAAERVDVVVSGDAAGFYDLVVERRLAAVRVEGDVASLVALLETLPPKVDVPQPRTSGRSSFAISPS